jgi:hypothetical protein
VYLHASGNPARCGIFNGEKRFEQRKERRTRMEETLLQGPVLMVNGQLTLMIPLEDGVAELAACSRGNSEVAGACLKIAIPEWLAGMLRIDEGDIVRVSNWDGKLRIEPSEARVVQ